MAAATTAGTDWDKFPKGGVLPGDGPSATYVAEESDTDHLDEANDILKLIPIGIGCVPADGYVDFGDFDAGSGHVCSIIIYDGSSTHEVAKALTTGQGGGLARFGAGTAPDRVPRGAISASGAYFGVKTTTAPATAQTASRTIKASLTVVQE